MIHSGHHEKPFKLPGALHPAIRSNNSFEIVDRSARKDELIGPTVIGDDLPAMVAEAGQIRAVGTDDVVKLLLGLLEACRETSEIQGVPIKAGVLFNPKAPVVQGDGKGS